MHLGWVLATMRFPTTLRTMVPGTIVVEARPQVDQKGVPKCVTERCPKVCNWQWYSKLWLLRPEYRQIHILKDVQFCVSL